MINLILLILSTTAFAGWYPSAEISANNPVYKEGYTKEYCIKKFGLCREYSGDLRFVKDNSGNLEFDQLKKDAYDAAKLIEDAAKAQKEADKEALKLKFKDKTAKLEDVLDFLDRFL